MDTGNELESALTTSSSSAAASDITTNVAATAHAVLVQLTTDGIPKLHCPVCDKALVSLNGYVKHVQKHEPPGGFICRYCEERFCSEDELKRHRDEVHITIACRICKDVTFTNETDYRVHIRDVHNGVDREMYKCEKCNAEYKTLEPYRRHMSTECGTIKPYKCDQCPMSFVTKYNLKQHKESHSGERKFCCSYCGKNFLQKGRLVEHERSHTGEKPYKCDICGKCFAHRESIVTHSSIHTGIRLVECRCCLSRFSCYSNLIKHRRTRQDTCGLPEYDPPKNRVRTHRSRIPPTLNPTSEIKVSNLNKIIKPVDMKQVKKPPLKKELQVEQPKQQPLKQKRASPKSRKNKRRKSETDTEDEEQDDDNGDANSEVDKDYVVKLSSQKIPKRELRATRKTQNSSIETSQETPWNDTELEEHHIYFEPEDIERDGNPKELMLPPANISIKQEFQQDPDDFEYTDPNQYMESDFNIKNEHEANIFRESEQLLDSLLSDENDHEETLTFANENAPKIVALPNAIKVDDGTLQESEVVLIKDELAGALQEEDMLAVEGPALNCQIMIEDIKRRYPRLKEKPTVRVGRNATPFFHLNKKQRRDLNRGEKPARKYRKRGEPKLPNPNAPKRVARLSQLQLKERLKVIKKEGKSWQCPHCIKIYYMKKPYEKHLRDDHKRPEEEIKGIFQIDEIGVINDELFKCHICDKIYLVEKRLISHVKLHGSDGNLIFKCPCYCNIFFATKDEATTHARQEHRDLLFCEICQKFMTGHDSLKNHMKNHHTDKSPRNAQRNLVCDKCGKKFSGRTSLTDHVRSDCGRKPLYPCHVCGKHLTTAGILKTHLLLHKDDTPYQCDKCGKNFKVKAQYKTHIKTRHSDFKPFKCHLCPKEYPYRESLLTHMTVHTGIKRFLCNGCGKRFTCISNLQAHRKVHADTCGVLPLNAKATQYMGVQKGNLLLGAKPEAGLDYIETNTLVAREVMDKDSPMCQELNYPSEPAAPLATVPLNYSQPLSAAHTMMLPQMAISHFIDDSHSSSFN